MLSNINEPHARTDLVGGAIFFLLNLIPESAEYQCVERSFQTAWNSKVRKKNCLS